MEFPASPRHFPSCACSSSKPLSLLPLPQDPWMVVESVEGASASALCGRKIQPGGNLFVRFRLRIYFGRVWRVWVLGPQIFSGKVTSQPWHGCVSSKFVCFLGCCPFTFHLRKRFFLSNDRCSKRDHFLTLFRPPRNKSYLLISKVMGKAQSCLHCRRWCFHRVSKILVITLNTGWNAFCMALWKAHNSW